MVTFHYHLVYEVRLGDFLNNVLARTDLVYRIEIEGMDVFY